MKLRDGRRLVHSSKDGDTGRYGGYARNNTSKHAAAGIDHARHALLDTLPNANEGPWGEGSNEQKRGTHLHPYSIN